MKKTSYSLWGKFYVYGSVIYFFVAMFTLMMLSFSELEIVEDRHKLFALCFLFFLIIASAIDVWLHPMVIIEDDGIMVWRFYFIRRKIKWTNTILKKRMRGFTRPDVIGLDPRYALIVIKDATIVDKYAIILPFFKGYDDFIAEIEKHLNSANVYTDKNYH